MRPLVVATAVLASAAFLLGPAPSATADIETFKDGHTTDGPMDIHRVTVANRKRLQVRIKIQELEKKTGRSAGVWLDTDPEHQGPDFFIGSGLYQSDWQITRTEGWKLKGDPLSCPVDQRLRYVDEVISWTVGEKCLGSYDTVRVSAQTSDEDVNDYSPDRHKWHGWVDRY